MINDRNLVVIVPTYNNCNTLENVVLRCKMYCKNIIVVNDGSSDNTQAILESISEIDYISFSKNMGKGAALKAGLRKAVEHNFEYAITIDSDGQHFPEEINLFIDASIKEPDTLWVGSRNLYAENMPEKSSFANKFSNFWFKAETGITLSDTQSGFRLYPLKPFSRMKYFSGRYEFELEILIRAAWKGVQVKNLPIKVYYPPKEERVSHFRPFRDFIRISLLNTVFVFFAFLWYWPYRFVMWFNKKNLRNFVQENITLSKDSNFRIANAIGLGLFFGVAPLWGYQMVSAVVAAHILKLNKILVLVASNISIPPIIPFILYGSFATGAFVLDVPLNIVPASLTLASIAVSLKLYLIGSIIFALICGLSGFIISYLLLLLFRKPVR